MKRSNASVLNEIQKRLSKAMFTRKMKYFGHFMRKENGMEHRLIEEKIEGIRPRGHQYDGLISYMK